MAAKNQNFRKNYYKTLGVPVVQDVDVQASFRALMSDTVIDLDQLLRVAMQYGVPSMYRSVTWILMLGILPVHKEAWDFVREQRIATFQDISSTSQVLEPETSPSLHGLYRLYHTVILGLPSDALVENERFLKQLCSVLQSIFTQEWEQFWCLVSLMEIFSREHVDLSSPMPDNIESIIFRSIGQQS